MPRIVRCGLIQARNVLSPEAGLPAIKKAMIDKHLQLIEEAAAKKAKILCLQELFYGPYFCAEQETSWYHTHRAGARRAHHPPHAEARQEARDGHGGARLRGGAAGVYYNTAAVIDADGSYLGKYRKTHIPHA